MVYKAYRSYCLAGTGDFPAEAVPVSQPFAPLLLLHLSLIHISEPTRRS